MKKSLLLSSVAVLALAASPVVNAEETTTTEVATANAGGLFHDGEGNEWQGNGTDPNAEYSTGSGVYQEDGLYDITDPNVKYDSTNAGGLFHDGEGNERQGNGTDPNAEVKQGDVLTGEALLLDDAQKVIKVWTHNNKTTVSGTTEPGATVILKDSEGKEIAVVVADEEGKFSFVTEEPVKDEIVSVVFAKDGKTLLSLDAVVLHSATGEALVQEETTTTKEETTEAATTTVAATTKAPATTTAAGKTLPNTGEATTFAGLAAAVLALVGGAFAALPRFKKEQ